MITPLLQTGAVGLANDLNFALRCEEKYTKIDTEKRVREAHHETGELQKRGGSRVTDQNAAAQIFPANRFQILLQQ